MFSILDNVLNESRVSPNNLYFLTSYVFTWPIKNNHETSFLCKSRKKNKFSNLTMIYIFLNFIRQLFCNYKILFNGLFLIDDHCMNAASKQVTTIK